MTTKQTLKAALQKNYWFTVARWRLRTLLDEWQRRQPLIVYQMGKVGSSSIVASLKALPATWTVHHVHTLTTAGMASAEAIYHRICRESGSSYFPRARHLLSSRYLQQQLRRRAQGQATGARWKVITLVREPVGRNISEFFQVIDYTLPNFVERYNTGALSMEETVQTFLERFDHETTLRWFDQEIKPTLGIDVFATPFPKTQGYQIYKGAQADLLLLKLEQLDECGGQAFEEFLGLRDFSVVKTNVAAEKAYGDAYQRFQSALALSPGYLARMYNSPYMRHFYSAAEIAAFQASW